MKKIFAVLIAALMVFGFAVADSNAAMRHFEAKVFKMSNDLNNLVEISDTVTYKVLQASSDSSETIYSDANRTAMTNPVAASVFTTKDRVDFWCDPTATDDLSIDLIVVDQNGGFTAFLEDFKPTTHSIVIDERPNIRHTGVIWTEPAAQYTVYDGVKFLADTAVHNVKLEVVTVLASQTMDIGMTTDADGFLNEASLTTATVIDPMSPTYTAVGTYAYISTATVVGELLGKSLAGIPNTSTIPSVAFFEGVHTIRDHTVTSAGSLAYAAGSVYGSAPKGYIVYEFTRYR